jgi:hypothetical protein
VMSPETNQTGPRLVLHSIQTTNSNSLLEMLALQGIKTGPKPWWPTEQSKPWVLSTTLSAPGKASLDGVNETGWKPMLRCSPALRAVAGGHAGSISMDPSRPETA